MPVHKVKGGYKWGSKGKVYKSKKEAAKQGRAAYANGYRGDMPTPPPSEGNSMPVPVNSGPDMPKFKRPPANTPINMGQTVPNDLAIKPIKHDVAGNNSRAYSNPALPSDPLQPLPVPADPPKSTQNRGGQPMSMPDIPAAPWGNGGDKTRWPTLGGSGPIGGGLGIG